MATRPKQAIIRDLELHSGAPVFTGTRIAAIEEVEQLLDRTA